MRKRHVLGPAAPLLVALALAGACSETPHEEGAKLSPEGGDATFEPARDGASPADAPLDAAPHDAADASDGSVSATCDALDFGKPIVTNVQLGNRVAPPVVADATAYYFVKDQGSVSSLWSVPRAGGTQTQVVEPIDRILAHAVDGTNLVYTTAGDVLRCPLRGLGAGGPSFVATGQITPRRRLRRRRRPP